MTLACVVLFFFNLQVKSACAPHPHTVNDEFIFPVYLIGTVPLNKHKQEVYLWPRNRWPHTPPETQSGFCWPRSRRTRSRCSSRLSRCRRSVGRQRDTGPPSSASDSELRETTETPSITALIIFRRSLIGWVQTLSVSCNFQSALEQQLSSFLKECVCLLTSDLRLLMQRWASFVSAHNRHLSKEPVLNCL